MADKAPIAKPNRKCIEKNLFKVCSHTVNPPHNNSTTFLPIRGIIEKKFVITVAAQKDICPQGNTYPVKASAIKAKKINNPDHHTFFF